MDENIQDTVHYSIQLDRHVGGGGLTDPFPLWHYKMNLINVVLDNLDGKISDKSVFWNLKSKFSEDTKQKKSYFSIY